MATHDFHNIYGEYTLKKWVRMILTGEIELPEFQRSFVWDHEQGLNLMNRLLHGDFVPPVVVAFLKWGTGSRKTHNLILDGQQRLSTIALFYLGYWPTGFNAKDDSLNALNTDEPSNNDDDEAIIENIQEWTFHELTKLYKENKCSIENLRHALDADTRYTKITVLIGNNRLQKNLYGNMGNIEQGVEENYLGFSFIKPVNIEMPDARQTYSRIFRSINMSGTALTAAQSRAALAWLKVDRAEFLQPEYAKNITVNNRRIDWVRLLSLVSEAAKIYKNDPSQIDNEFRVAVGQSRKMESYYEDFVLAMTEEHTDRRFLPYNPDLAERSKNFAKVLSTMVKNKVFNLSFKNTIEADICLMGAIFLSIFRPEKVRISVADLKEKLRRGVERASSERALNNPNLLGELRPRLTRSIRLYERCIIDEE